MIEAYIAKYGKEPNATQLIQFSKSDSRYKAISFKEAKKLLNIKPSPSKRKNAIKPPTPSAANKIDKDDNKNNNKPKEKKSFWSKRNSKRLKDKDVSFLPPAPPPKAIQQQLPQNNKPKSMWDINENDGDDPMGATYRKKAILNDYNMNKSAINDISAESMAKQ